MTANSICSLKGTDGIKEVLIKSGAHIAQSDFLSACMKATQEYCIVFKVKIHFGVFVQDDENICNLNLGFRCKMCAKSSDVI